jgi:hypothetical protein
MNNTGTAKELAEYVLADTDWKVESETFIETIDEALVYISLPNNLNAYEIYKIKDQSDDELTKGITPQSLSTSEKNSLRGKTVLAFYSSCKNKPHYF